MLLGRISFSETRCLWNRVLVQCLMFYVLFRSLQCTSVTVIKIKNKTKKINILNTAFYSRRRAQVVFCGGLIATVQIRASPISPKDWPSSVPHQNPAIFMQFSPSFLCFILMKILFVFFVKSDAKYPSTIYALLLQFFFKRCKKQILILKIIFTLKYKGVLAYLLSALF